MYIGKIEENLFVWLEEHASDKESSDFDTTLIVGTTNF